MKRIIGVFLLVVFGTIALGSAPAFAKHHHYRHHQPVHHHAHHKHGIASWF
jgi:hypothetical protein